MPDALDQTRFSPPDFAPGEEQRLIDREREMADLDAAMNQIIYGKCKDWSDRYFLELAYRALDQVAHMNMRHAPARTQDWRIWKAHTLLDDAARWEREKGGP